MTGVQTCALPISTRVTDLMNGEFVILMTLGRHGEARIVVSEEQLQVGKRIVEAGEVRIRKHVEAEQVRETVSVMREDVTVERRPVPAGVGLEPRTEGDTLYVPIVEEEIVVTKRLIAREELVIRKRQVMEEQVIEETLHHERAEVLGPDDVDQTPR